MDSFIKRSRQYGQWINKQIAPVQLTTTIDLCHRKAKCPTVDTPNSPCCGCSSWRHSASRICCKVSEACVSVRSQIMNCKIVCLCADRRHVHSCSRSYTQSRALANLWDACEWKPWSRYSAAKTERDSLCLRSALPVGVCYPRIRPATQMQIQQPIQIQIEQQIHLQVAPAKRVSGGIRHEATSHNLNIH